MKLSIAAALLSAAVASAADIFKEQERLGDAVLEQVLEDGDIQQAIGNAGKTLGRRPNIVFVLTDDQDLHLQSLDYLPLIKKHLRDQGTEFQRHFCTTAICCPSRVSLWTGRQAHNTNVTDVSPPHGGYPKFISQGLNENYLPVWLQRSGYNTYYTGKLFNAHSINNYNNPHPAGWTGSDFLLDPFTYHYLNATFQRNDDPPVSYEGQYSVDVLADKAFGFLEEAAQKDEPFFLGIAPIAPHSNAVYTGLAKDGIHVNFTEPVAAARHAHLFADVQVPRTPHFNPEEPSGAAWVRRLRRQTEANVAFNDHYYRQRLRALQSVDELVDGLFERLERLGLLESTYVFYTSDNGFHIGQHRLQPGKECGFEEDINVPLVVRGPGIPAGHVSQAVTTHIDLAPTLLQLAGVPAHADLDGEPIPLTAEPDADETSRHEHVTVEFWGSALAEGSYWFSSEGEDEADVRRVIPNNTYKAVRIIGPTYNLYYSVWCSGEHELYNLDTDPYQLKNLLGDSLPSASSASSLLLGHPLPKVVARLDALLLVLKSCRGRTCVRPWDQLHPDGGVHSLSDALGAPFDHFYEKEQPRVAYSRCEAGYLVDAEGPQFEHDGVVYRDGAPWHEWV